MTMSPETNAVVELLKIGTFLIRTGNRIVASTGLSQQQFVILNAITEQAPVSQTELRTELSFERSNLSKSVSRLLDMELILAEPSPLDGRVLKLAPTEKGKRAVCDCMPMFESWGKNWAGTLDEEELATLTKLLGKLRKGSQTKD